MTTKQSWIPVFKVDFLIYDDLRKEWKPSNNPPINSDDWDSCIIEYSVARSNSHGVKSWGWEDDANKIILFHECDSKSNLEKKKQICINFAKLLNDIEY